jgi:hypothetical protein
MNAIMETENGGALNKTPAAQPAAEACCLAAFEKGRCRWR